MKINTRNGIRLFFLFLIFALWFTGNIQIWGPLLGFSLLLIPFGGRIYCGWMCPISTSIDLIKPALKTPVFKKFETALLNKKTKTFIFILSIALLVIFKKNNFFVPFFIFLIPVGIIFTYLFGEACWHRNCFIGIIYSWFGKLARKGYYFETQNCPKCNLCIDICPNACIESDTTNNYKIANKDCLVCNKCKEVCPSTNISYGSLKKQQKA